MEFGAAPPALPPNVIVLSETTKLIKSPSSGKLFVLEISASQPSTLVHVNFVSMNGDGDALSMTVSAAQLPATTFAQCPTAPDHYITRLFMKPSCGPLFANITAVVAGV